MRCKFRGRAFGGGDLVLVPAEGDGNPVQHSVIRGYGQSPGRGGSGTGFQ